jgi:hypothetical protein
VPVVYLALPTRSSPHPSVEKPFGRDGADADADADAGTLDAQSAEGATQRTRGRDCGAEVGALWTSRARR